MTEKFTNVSFDFDEECIILQENNSENYYDEKGLEDLLNEQAKTIKELREKPFLKIIDDYYIKFGDEGELFNLHKPSDIRSLISWVNRENGFSELQCEYNDLSMGGDFE